MQASSSVISALPIETNSDLAWVRRQVRRAATDLGLGLVQQTRLVTAASELARNALVHGGGGEVEIAHVATGGGRGLRLVFTDRGPGIPDLDQVLTGGPTTGGGLGMGLGGTKRLVHEFAIESGPGVGTTIQIIVWASGLPSPR